MERISSNQESNSTTFNENYMYPIDLSIFKEHVRASFLAILDGVFNF
jgi:hypothetical protein